MEFNNDDNNGDILELMATKQLSILSDNDGTISYNDLTNKYTKKYSCYCIPILHPFGPFKLCWDSFIMLLLVMTIIQIPFVFAFSIDSTLNTFYGEISFSVDCILLIDILISFRTAYFDKIDQLRLIASPKLIAKTYVKSWFIIDLLTSFPFEFVLPLFTKNGSNINNAIIRPLRIFRIVRIIKILRLIKILKFLDGVVSQFIVREITIVLRFLRIIFKMLIFAHVIGCLWYYIGVNTKHYQEGSWISEIDNFEKFTDFEKYSYSLYWAVVTLFTLGIYNTLILY